MADVHVVLAKFAKVSVGPAGGNQVARILRAGEVVPQGVPEGDLDRLVKRKIIRKLTAAQAKKLVGEKQEPATESESAGEQSSGESSGESDGDGKADRKK